MYDYPTCDKCDKPATVVIYLCEQFYIATLTTEGLADESHAKLFGLPERIGEDCYYCQAHNPSK